MPPPVMSKPSKAAHMAIAYVTLGALLMVWSAIWYCWMLNHQAPADQPHNDAPFYWCAVVFFTGLTVFVIGLALGRIGRAGRARSCRRKCRSESGRRSRPSRRP